MLERDSYPAGVPGWVETSQADLEAALAFYGDLFGWEFDDRTVEGSGRRSFVATIRGLDVAGVNSAGEDAPSTPGWTSYVAVDDADATIAATLEAGGSVIVEPSGDADPGRGAVLADPSGADFGVWQAGTHAGAQLVNEPGTWNFSELNHRTRTARRRSTARCSAGRPA